MAKSKKDQEEVTTTVVNNPAALSAAMKAVNKKYGYTVAGNTADFDFSIEVIPTSSINLNRKLGMGGFVRGRVVEIFGSPGTGKTSISYDVIGNAQKIALAQDSGKVSLLVDAEKQFHKPFAESYGVDVDRLAYVNALDGEANLDIMETIIKSGMVDVAVVDSVAALAPRSEMEGAIDDQHMMLHPRLMSTALRRLAPLCASTKTLLIFINQIRSTPDMYKPDVTPGGNALKFFTSYRLEISGGTSQSSRLKEGDVVYGHTQTLKIVKNRFARPFQKCELDLIYGKGFDLNGELLKLGVSTGIVEKSGTWYNYGETKLGQGEDNAKVFLSTNEDIFNDIKTKVLKEIKDMDG